MKKFNLTKIGLSLALSAQIFCQTAMAIVPYEGIYKTPMDKTFNDFSFKVYKPIYTISDKAQQDKLFEMADYFSKNSPFSKTQIEQYFDDTFVTKKSENNGYFIANIFEPTKTNIIKTVDFRDANESQLLIFELKEPVCFTRDEFTNMMEKQGCSVKSPKGILFKKNVKSPRSNEFGFGKHR